jgi:hypothetical protein
MAEYLEPSLRATYKAGVEAWLRAHPGRAGWCRFEAARKAVRRPDLPAATDLALAGRDGVERFVLALSEWHPTALQVDAGAMAAAGASRAAAEASAAPVR